MCLIQASSGQEDCLARMGQRIKGLRLPQVSVRKQPNILFFFLRLPNIVFFLLSSSFVCCVCCFVFLFCSRFFFASWRIKFIYLRFNESKKGAQTASPTPTATSLSQSTSTPLLAAALSQHLVQGAKKGKYFGKNSRVVACE